MRSVKSLAYYLSRRVKMGSFEEQRDTTYWETGAKERIMLPEMDSDHIENCIKYISRRSKMTIDDNAKIEIFSIELALRGLDTPNIS